MKLCKYNVTKLQIFFVAVMHKLEDWGLFRAKNERIHFFGWILDLEEVLKKRRDDDVLKHNIVTYQIKRESLMERKKVIKTLYFV